MTANSELHKQLLTAHQERKTGKLFIFGKLSGQSVAMRRPVEIDLRDGEIVALFDADQTDAQALDGLLKMTVVRVLFMAADTVPARANSNTPTVTDVLQQLTDNLGTEKPATDSAATTELTATELVFEAQRILSEIYGDKAANKVQAIAAKHPPEQAPANFLAQCEQEVTMMLGAQLARERFSHLANGKTSGKASVLNSVGDSEIDLSHNLGLVVA